MKEDLEKRLASNGRGWIFDRLLRTGSRLKGDRKCKKEKGADSVG